jgi:hypothetical protein
VAGGTYQDKWNNAGYIRKAEIQIDVPSEVNSQTCLNTFLKYMQY